ncbi:MAG: ABC transporter permease [Acidobacteria bacterium]|nr:ABC transporter permease [Acidobacteriota bacterium]
MLSDMSFSGAAGDMRFALRTLAKNPWFTAAAVLVLAIGIGANTAVFSLANALVLNPYPFPNSERIVLLLGVHSSGQNHSTGYRDFLDWREQSHSYEALAIAPNPTAATLTGAGEPERLRGFIASAGIFRVLGVQPFLGRAFTEAEDRPEAARVLVLSYPGWRRLFHSAPDVLGRTMTLDGNSYAIVGVMPESAVFPGLGACDFWVPLRENAAAGRMQHQYGVLARLKAGVSMESAQAEISGVARRLELAYPDTNKGWGVQVMPLREALAGSTRRPVGALLLAVLAVLLLACANIAGLQLARASARAREIAIRTSLGATRARVVRQLMTESVLLAAAGGAMGVFAARWMMTLLAAAAPDDLDLAASLRMDSTALLFAMAASLAAGVVFGVAPALHASRAGLTTIVRGGAAALAKSRNRTLAALVAVEVMLSAVLLIGATQVARSLATLMAADAGVRAEGVLTFGLNLPRLRYREGHRSQEFYRDLLERLRNSPEVASAAAVDSLPMSGVVAGGPFEIEGRPKPADWMQLSGQSILATPGYFRTLGIPVIRGRDFEERDTPEAEAVGVVSELLARRFFPGQDPIGHRMKDAYGGWRTIVGVVGNVRRQGPSKHDTPQLYSPLAQNRSLSMTVALRSTGDPSRLAGAARAAVHAIDPALAVVKMRTMQQVVADSMSEPRMVAMFLTGFAGFALLLAVIGIYGTVAYSVSQRTRELGVRLALGASRSGVLRMVVGQALMLAAVGLLLALPVAVAASGLIASYLEGASASAPLAFIAIPALLMMVAAAASYPPALRASRVDPAITLREE